jgi:hypothetical protein
VRLEGNMRVGHSLKLPIPAKLDIVWRPDADPHRDLPEYLLFVPSSAYSGPYLFRDDEGQPVIPIKPVMRSWLARSVNAPSGLPEGKLEISLFRFS